MINTLRPGASQGHEDQKGEILDKIQQKYGKPEEKQREATKKLGKDEFFKIMVTQIQHQDPLKPYENEQMAAQMAQFSALEQMMNVNSNLEKLTQSQQPLQNMGAASLIGKYVSADSSRIAHTEGHASDIAFDLPVDADHVRAIILNDRGENIREIELKNLKKGENKIEWDGKNSSKFAAKTGQYMVQISATSEQGKNIPVQTQNTAVVHGVAFEGKETVLLVGDIRRPQKLFLRNIYKIVDPSDLKKQKAESGAADGTPQISSMGLPEGVGLDGLQELMQQQLAERGMAGGAAQEGGEAKDPNAPFHDPIADQINAADRPTGGYDPGVASRYTPIDAGAMRKSGMKPEVEQKPTDDDIRHAMESMHDLTSANPVAEAIRQGAVPAAGQSMQSSADGSTAGKLAE